MKRNTLPDGPGRDTWSYECVDPLLGREIWRLDTPDLDPLLADRLQNHLAICDACRLQHALGPSLVQARPGKRTLHPRLAPRVLIEGGGVLLAASLALLLLLPPRSRDADLVLRNSGAKVIERPVEGEVVLDLTPRLSWQPVPGATAYRLTLDELDGDFIWRGKTAGTVLEVPGTATLPRNRDFRFMIEPVPEDLAPPGGWTSSFSTGDLRHWLGYRLAASRPSVHWLSLAGISCMLAAALLKLIRP